MKSIPVVLLCVTLVGSVVPAAADSDFKKLMGLPGVVAAGEFTPDGKVVKFEGIIPPKAAEMVALMCAANSMMGKMQANGFSQFSGMNWLPFHGFAVTAGDYTVCVMGNRLVFVETDKANFNTLFHPQFTHTWK
jgi:roadblock/LC7 domain-containing protein